MGNSFSFRPNCLPKLTNNPYNVVSFLEFEYNNLIGKFDFSTLSWILDNTFFTTNVLPVPGFPYTSKFDGLDCFRIGKSD